MSHKPGLFHKGCNGEIEEDCSVIYPHQLSNGTWITTPAYRCKKCGKEILGDSAIDLYNLSGELTD